MSDAKLKSFIASFDPDERMGQVAGMQLKAARKEARKRGILNETCKPTKLDSGAEVCIVPMKQDIDWEKEEKQWEQADIEDEKFYRMKGHADRQARERKPTTIAQAVSEASPDLPSSNFKHTEEYSIEFGKEIDFARWIAQQLEIMGVTQEQAERLYKASKEGDYSWVHRFGASPKLKALVGHNIGTAMTSNAVAIHNGMGLHAGILKIRPKQNRPPSRIPDDLLPGGPDDDEARDRRRAAAFGPPADPRGIQPY